MRIALESGCLWICAAWHCSPPHDFSSVEGWSSVEVWINIFGGEEKQMSYADDVRDHCRREYVEPARRRGDHFVEIRAGDVHGELNYRNRYPLVCSALGTKVSKETCRIVRVAVEGPLNGANTRFRFKLNP